MLNNYTASFSNILFWLENPEIIINLSNIEVGQINIDKIGYTIHKSNKYSNINDIFKEKMNINSIGNFLKYVNRYVKPWSNKQNQNIDKFPMGIYDFLSICNLSHDVYNIDMIFSDIVSNNFKCIDYYEMSVDFDEDIMKFIINKFSSKVNEYKEGKHGISNMIMSEYIKLSNGNQDRKFLMSKIIEYLNRLD